MKNIYFDNAATSFPKPAAVADAVSAYFAANGCNPGRGSYPGALEAENVLFDARQLLKQLFNAPDERNVIFTPGDTWSLNMLIKGIARKGDVFMTTSMEHNSVMRPLYSLCGKGDITLYTIQCDPDGQLSYDEMYEQLNHILLSAHDDVSRSLRAVVMTHGSNITGSLLPVEAAGDFCREHGLFLIVDAAQTAGLVPIDVRAMNIDGLCFSGHKGLMGPQGIGGFIISDRLSHELSTIVEGGTGSDSHLLTMPDHLPDRFEAGTLNIPGIFGLKESLNYVLTVGVSNILNKENLLKERFLTALRNIKGICIYGNGPLPVVSLVCSAMDPAVLCRRLSDEYGIWTRSGLHCAPEAHRTLGTYPVGTVRFSLGYYNTDDEIDYCINALGNLISI
ncbi:MAG: aminotransferase class V-fold PLP-dependent enzyme [Lachnospiraceae bacterium]|nr:aminotransferase class V-fold PLP-dependent enzyme [Lachnospiraceae bacterium]